MASDDGQDGPAGPVDDGTGPGDNRPTFTDYWRRTKDGESARSITFVPSSSGLPAGTEAKDEAGPLDASGRDLGPSQSVAVADPSPPPSSSTATAAAGLTKKQARRAQVRKAQIQHRQRKVDYTKHLEMESARLRDIIEQTEREVRALEAENNTMRQRLSTKLSLSLAPLQSPTSSITATDVAGSAGWNAPGFDGSLMTVDRFAMPPPAPVYSVSMSMSPMMGTPVLQVRRTSSDSEPSDLLPLDSPAYTSPHAAPRLGSNASDTTTNRSHEIGRDAPALKASFLDVDFSATMLTEEQTDHAINFILGLEHICWDHWDHSYFRNQPTYDDSGCMHGHAMMASTIALRSAPADVFDQVDAIGTYFRSTPQKYHDHHHHQHQHQAPSEQFSSCPTASASSDMGGPGIRPGAQPPPPAPTNPLLKDISWPVTGLTLGSLHALASSLSPPETELAPVQAWFEILRLHGPDVVLNSGLMTRVLAEFAGVVKCLHFGAVIERDAFESVVGRVITASAAGVAVGTTGVGIGIVQQEGFS